MQIARRDLWSGVLVATIWGCNFSVIELGLRSLDPFILTFLRFTLCALPAIFFIKRPEGVSYSVLALYGVLFGTGLWWLVNFAMYKGLSAGMSSIFLQFSAFFTILLSGLFLKERVSSVHLSGMMFSASGLLLILYLADERSTVLGIGLVILAAVSWSVCNLIVKIQKPADMVAFVIWSSLFSAPAVLIMTLAVKGLEPFEGLLAKITYGAAFSVLFQSYITTLFGYAVWNSLMKKYPASTVAPLSLIVPLSGMLASVAFFDERLSAVQGLGIALVFIGISIFMNSDRIQNSLSSKKHV